MCNPQIMMDDTGKLFVGLLKAMLKILPDTRIFDEHDPSWGYAWNVLSDEAQEMVSANRVQILRAIKELESL